MSSLTFPLYSRETILAHGALLAQLEGRANAVRLPFCPGPTGARVLPRINGVPYAGRNLWLRPGVLPESLGVAPTVRVTALAGATEIVLNMGTLVGLEPGVIFGLGERLYIVTEMHGVSVTNVKFRPKLRFQINAGTAVNWKNPRCIMRLQTDDSGRADIALRRTGSAQMDFVEVW
jgi:hypothetical protein